ncbi:hypothetical protein K8I61_08865 [bacterium]|nr:hypothetical protein [bacterium]
MESPIYAAIRLLLDGAGIEYRTVRHEPTTTSEQSAAARGEELRVGGKALLVKADDAFALFVLSAARRFDSAAARRELGARRTRFATPEELDTMTGLVPGAVPPFGAPILPFRLYVDPSITQNERIAFNAGSLTDSIVMSVDDYLRVARPAVFVFSKE